MKKLTLWGEEGFENAQIDEVISGLKKALCTPEALYYSHENEEGPFQTNDKVHIFNSLGEQKCIIRIKEVKIIRFGDVNDQLAGDVLDSDLQDFRDAHRFYWEEDLQSLGLELTDELPVVVEYFEVE